MASDLAVRAFYEKVCTEALPKSPLFGVSLDKYMELQKKTIPFMNEPWIVRKCCDYLRDHGALETFFCFILQSTVAYTDTHIEFSSFNPMQ
jgi:hypothetical protein